MIKITKTEKEELENVGLIQYKRIGRNAQDPNLVIANKEHVSRNKRYYVVETVDILAYLEHYETLNLQKIRPNQLEQLKTSGLVTEGQIQYPGEYKPMATVFVAHDGTIRCKKIAKYLITVGIWKQNGQKTKPKTNNNNN